MLSSSAKRIVLAIVVFASFGAVVVPGVSASSALDQYVEEIPDTKGGDSGTKSPKGDKPFKIGKKQAEKLAAAGEEGLALLALASASGPSAGPPGAGEGNNGADGSAQTPARVKSQIGERPSGLENSLSAAVATSGFSFPLFLAVLILAFAMGGVAWARRQGSSS